MPLAQTLLLAIASLAGADSSSEGVAAVARRVAATAGREFAAPVTSADVDPETLRRRIGATLDALLPPPRAAGLAAGLAAFRLFPADVDLRAHVIDGFNLALIGAEDPRDLAGQIKATRVLAFESVGAEVDAARFLGAARNDDERLARLAVLFGVALDLADRTLRDHAAEVAAAVAERAVADPSEWDPWSQLAKSDARPWQIAVFTFAIADGERFVRSVRDRDPAAVARILADPPASTEQVREPAKWLARDDPPRPVAAPDLLPELGAGWALAAEETLGRLQLEAFIAGEGEPVRALRAAAGWGGDRYRVYRSAAGAVLLEWVAEFDAESDAGETVDALSKVFARRYHVASGARPSWGTLDPTDRAEHVDAAGKLLEVAARRGTRVAYLSGPGAERAPLLEAALAK